MLYSLVGQGVTVVNSTAYLDEAERCHRVALLHQGRLLFCDSPARLKSRLQGAVVSIVSSEARRVRDELTAAEGVSSLVLVGDAVHLFVDDADRRIRRSSARGLTSSQIPFDEIVQRHTEHRRSFRRGGAQRRDAAWRHDAPQRQFGRSRKPGEAFRRFHRRRSHFISDAHRRSLRISRTQRLGKIDHDSHPVRIAASDLRPRDRRRLRRRRVARIDPPQHRLHVAEIFALRRSHRVRESALLRGHVRRARDASCAGESIGRSRWLGCAAANRASPARSPADGSSGSRSAAPCCIARRLFFSTSRLQASIRSRAACSGN